MKQIYQLLICSLLAFYTTNITAQTKKPATKAPAKTTIVKKTTTTTQKAPAKATAKKTPAKAPVKKPVAKDPETAPPPPPPAPVTEKVEAIKQGRPISFEAGVTIAAPLRTFNLFQGPGFGLDVAARYALPDKLSALSVGARMNFAYFVRNPNQLFGVPHGTVLVNFMPIAQYSFPFGLIAGGGLGLGVATGGGSINAGLAKQIYAGYELKIPNYTLVFSGFFGQSMSATKNIGIRAAVKF